MGRRTLREIIWRKVVAGGGLVWSFAERCGMGLTDTPHEAASPAPQSEVFFVEK